MSTSLRALVAFFGVAGLLHFVRPQMYVAIMPDEIPRDLHKPLVYVSGAAELAGAAAVAVPATRRIGAWWLVATLIAVFPANLHMAMRPERYRRVPPALLWGRLPLQALLAAWTLRATRMARPNRR